MTVTKVHRTPDSVCSFELNQYPDWCTCAKTKLSTPWTQRHGYTGALSFANGTHVFTAFPIRPSVLTTHGIGGSMLSAASSRNSSGEVLKYGGLTLES